MDAPRDATMGSPLLVPFDGSAHAESVFPYLALLADGDQDVILLQVVPEAHSLSSPMGNVMLSANDLRQRRHRRRHRRPDQRWPAGAQHR